MKQSSNRVRWCKFRERLNLVARLRDAADRRYLPAFACVLAAVTFASEARAEGATRDLSQFVELGVTFTITIALNPPAGTLIVGVEEAPPTGWTVSIISNGGTFDAGTGEVKWGPFFDPGIPPLVTYDVTPPTDSVGFQCFNGTVSYGGVSTPDIAGDSCIVAPIPAVTEWGLAVIALLILCGATILIRRPRVALG